MMNSPCLNQKEVRSGRGRIQSVSATILLAHLLGLSLVVGMGMAGSVSAQSLEPVQVYATSNIADTGPAGAVSIVDLPGGEIQGVFLWATGGGDGTTGPVCTKAGTGSALCGISFRLSVTGGYQLVDFTPNPDFDGSPTKLPFRTMLPSPSGLVANAFDLGDPSPENRYLGQLRLTANGANGDSRIEVTGSAIGADLSMREINSESIIVPEPRAVLMLGVGVIGLVACVRRRGGRRSDPFHTA